MSMFVLFHAYSDFNKNIKEDILFQRDHIAFQIKLILSWINCVFKIYMNGLSSSVMISVEHVNCNYKFRENPCKASRWEGERSVTTSL